MVFVDLYSIWKNKHSSFEVHWGITNFSIIAVTTLNLMNDEHSQLDAFHISSCSNRTKLHLAFQSIGKNYQPKSKHLVIMTCCPWFVRTVEMNPTHNLISTNIINILYTQIKQVNASSWIVSNDMNKPNFIRTCSKLPHLKHVHASSWRALQKQFSVARIISDDQTCKHDMHPQI